MAQSSIGIHAMWGFSPAVDLLALAPPTGDGTEEAKGSEPAATEGRVVRMLLASPADIRHVLVALSRRRRHPDVCGIEFHVLESQVEVLARHLLLLQIVNDWELPIRQRANVFLETFGNSLVQQRTQRYLHRLGQDLVELVCNGEGGLEELVDCGQLKYRDRDALVDCFHSWNPQVPYDVVGLRDTRLRAHFGQRYDHRANVIDWDYQTRVKPNGSIVHSKLYKEWRLSGTAFEFGEQVYDQPNRSLASYTEGIMKKGKDKGLKKEVRGYWLDIVNSPFVSFGVECDQTQAPHVNSLFQINNKDTGTEQHRHHSVEVAVYNLLSYLWEIETGSAYQMTKAHDIFSGLGEDADEAALRSTSARGGKDQGGSGGGAAEDHRRQQALARARCILDTLDQIKILPARGDVTQLYTKRQFQGAFDCVFLSSASAHHLDDSALPSLVKPGGAVVVESAKYVVPLTDQQQADYGAKVREMAAGQGLAEEPAPPKVNSSRQGADSGVLVFRRAT